MNSEVRFLKNEIIKIDNTIIQEMKNKAAQNASGKFRYCFHENENAGMQEMLFVISDTGYARPHMHKNYAESQVVLDGEGYCILFDSTGNIMETFKISSREYFCYRVKKGIWHMLLPISKQIVVYEVREGKFDSNTNIFPEWAPREDEICKAEEYKANLLKQIGAM